MVDHWIIEVNTVGFSFIDPQDMATMIRAPGDDLRLDHGVFHQTFEFKDLGKSLVADLNLSKSNDLILEYGVLPSQCFVFLGKVDQVEVVGKRRAQPIHGKGGNGLDRGKQIDDDVLYRGGYDGCLSGEVIDEEEDDQDD